MFVVYAGAVMAVAVPVVTLIWHIVRVGNKMYDTLEQHGRILENMDTKINNVENEVYEIKGRIKHGRETLRPA